MQCIKDYADKLRELREIQLKYSLDTTSTDEFIEEVENFRVTAPIIGNFSTGKSSMLNAIIGKRLLSVEITPETAVPTEIYYGENTVKQLCSDGKVKEHGIKDLPLKNLTVKDTELVRIEYDHPFLKEIANVKVVDLPGFDSGIELHNKAIDKYLPNALAYILVVACDEPVLKDNITNVVKELDLHDMPLYVVLSKSSRLSSEEIMEVKKLVAGIISKIIDNNQIKITAIESYGEVDVEGIKKFLLEIQRNSERLFEIKYKDRLKSSIRSMETFLLDQINKKDLSLSELEEEREALQNDINNLLRKIKRERERFDKQADECIKAITNKINTDLVTATSAIAALVQNGNNVNDKINTIVRNAVTIGIKSEFEPRLQKYLKNIANMINVDVLKDEGIKMNVDQLSTDNMIQDVAMKAVPIVLAAVGAIAGPVGIVVGGMVGAFIDSVVNVSQSKIKEKKAVEVAEGIIKTVTEQAGVGVGNEIKRYIIDVNRDIEKEILRQKEMLDKSLDDVCARVALEDSKKNEEIFRIECDLNQLRAI